MRNDFEDALKAIASRGMERAVMEKFPNETEALAYAAKVATLKKGDQIYFRHDGRRTPAIVAGFHEKRGQVMVLYWDEDKEIASVCIPYGSIELAE